MNGPVNHVFPGISLLGEEHILDVHKQSLKILQTTGVRVDSVAARSVFRKKTGSLSDGNIINIPEEVVEWALKKTPGTLSVYDRNGNMAFKMQAGEVRNTKFGIGVTNTHFQEVRTGHAIPFRREHNSLSVQLGHALSGYDMVSTIGIPTDVPSMKVDLYNTLDLYAHTTKPLILLLLEETQTEQVFELLATIHGRLDDRPGIMCYVNPITPLILNESTTTKINAAIRYGCPVIYSNYGMYGASTPFDPAGTLALMHAELLAGLVYCQLIREGAPVILGSLPAGFDMRTMTSTYSTASMLLNLACAEMMAHFKIPHCGTSGSGIGWGADLPASDHLWMNHLTSCLGKVGLVPFVGGNFNSLAFSPAMVVYSDLIISQVRDFISGFSLNESAFGLKEIHEAGPGGNFLTSPQTLSQFENKQKGQNFWSGMSLEQWQWDGSPEAGRRLKEHTLRILKNLQPPEGCKSIIEKGENFIRNLK